MTDRRLITRDCEGRPIYAGDKVYLTGLGITTTAGGPLSMFSPARPDLRRRGINPAEVVLLEHGGMALGRNLRKLVPMPPPIKPSQRSDVDELLTVTSWGEVRRTINWSPEGCKL